MTELYTFEVADLYKPKHRTMPFQRTPLERKPLQNPYLHMPVHPLVGATPMWSPNATVHSTPAWNAASRTPVWQPDTGGTTPSYSPSAPVPSTPAWNADARTPVWQPDAPTGGVTPSSQHLLFDPAIMNVNVDAIVTGGEYKNKKMVVYSSMVDGQQKILHRSYGTITILDSDWVALAPVNVTRYDRLLVVVKG